MGILLFGNGLVSGLFVVQTYQWIKTAMLLCIEKTTEPTDVNIDTLSWQIYSKCEPSLNVVFWLCGLGEVMIKWTEECPDPAKMTEILLTDLNWT